VPLSRFWTIAAIIVGIFLIIVAVMYFVEPAKSLPLPNLLGHESGSNHHHAKHGIAALLLSIACLVFAWFHSGPDRASAT
jgi:divalent metal cation (Fe/Co/Zn/Cd) transporter